MRYRELDRVSRIRLDRDKPFLLRSTASQSPRSARRVKIPPQSFHTEGKVYWRGPFRVARDSQNPDLCRHTAQRLDRAGYKVRAEVLRGFAAELEDPLE